MDAKPFSVPAIPSGNVFANWHAAVRPLMGPLARAQHTTTPQAAGSQRSAVAGSTPPYAVAPASGAGPSRPVVALFDTLEAAVKAEPLLTNTGPAAAAPKSVSAQKEHVREQQRRRAAEDEQWRRRPAAAERALRPEGGRAPGVGAPGRPPPDEPPPVGAGSTAEAAAAAAVAGGPASGQVHPRPCA